MREHPILFNAPMVRAILDGSKTQTRRALTRTNSVLDFDGGRMWKWSGLDFAGRIRSDYPRAFSADAPRTHGPAGIVSLCAFAADLPGYKPGERTVHRIYPRVRPGDRLWVRETWAPHPDGDDSGVVYRATDPGWDDANTNLKWRPSIHMPRWASRITLEITSVRVERVHAISDDDIRAEGVPTDDRLWLPGDCDDDDREDPREVGYEPRRVGAWARDNWMRLWISINGAESWASNPWVWALTFRRVAS